MASTTATAYNAFTTPGDSDASGTPVCVSASISAVTVPISTPAPT